jgi:hypothetical protein
MLDAEERMAALGKGLQGLARLRNSEFEEFLRASIWHQVARRIEVLEVLLQRHYSLPEFWANDVARHIEILRDRATDADMILPGDICGSEGPDIRLQAVKELVGRYGVLLSSWAGIRHAAAAVSERRGGMAVSLFG